MFAFAVKTTVLPKGRTSKFVRVEELIWLDFSTFVQFGSVSLRLALIYFLAGFGERMERPLLLGLAAASLSGCFCKTAAAATAADSRGTFVTSVLPAADGDAFAYVTVDEGETWSFTADAPFAITAVCSFQSTIFAFGNKKIHDEQFLEYAAQSKDGGKSWEQVRRCSFIRMHVFDCVGFTGSNVLD